jgi:dTDP-4-dehydrorhamnose 3,5-epimerase
VKVTEAGLPGLLLIEPQVYADERGFFLETWQKERYHQAGITAEFVQSNCARSSRGVLRGLHYQVRRPQGKLVEGFAHGYCVLSDEADFAYLCTDYYSAPDDPTSAPTTTPPPTTAASAGTTPTSPSTGPKATASYRTRTKTSRS